MTTYSKVLYKVSRQELLLRAKIMAARAQLQEQAGLERVERELQELTRLASPCKPDVAELDG